jgi:hypothetical protein
MFTQQNQLMTYLSEGTSIAREHNCTLTFMNALVNLDKTKTLNT